MVARFEILLHSNFGRVEYWAVSHVMLCNLYVLAIILIQCNFHANSSVEVT